jgi:beta-galactosidase beta subunit
MILDRIENAYLYAGLNAGFAKAFEVLTDPKLSQKKDGKYAIDGENIYYIIQRYTTKPFSESKLEAHRKYIDIQFLLAGTELIGYAPLTISVEKTSRHFDRSPGLSGRSGDTLRAPFREIYKKQISRLASGSLEMTTNNIFDGTLKDLIVVEEYNSEKDIAFYETPEEITKVILKPGLFCILFPDDAHQPACLIDKPAEVRKVVIKIRLDQESKK